MGMKIGNKGQGGGLIAGLVAIVVFVALLPTIKTSMQDADTLTTYTNESIAFVAGAGTIAKPEIQSITSIQNESTTLTAVTNYNYTKGTGAIVIGGSGIVTTATFNVTYVSGAPGYLDDSSARSVAGSVFLFVILGLLIFTVGIFGLIGM